MCWFLLSFNTNREGRNVRCNATIDPDTEKFFPTSLYSQSRIVFRNKTKEVRLMPTTSFYCYETPAPKTGVYFKEILVEVSIMNECNELL